MLVRLTEIFSNGAVTTPNTYTLREVFVNPEHVIMIREERRLKEMNERGILSENLNENHRFSKLLLTEDNQAPRLW
jgi:hypothetical protein